MAKDRYSTLGAKLGPRLAQMIAQANVHHDRQMLHTRHKLAMGVFEEASDMIGGELAAASGDLLRELAAHPDTPGHTERLLHLAASGQGQGGAITAAQMLGGAAAGSIGTLFSNALFPAVGHLVAKDPHIPPASATVAMLAARGFVSYPSARDTAAEQGLAPNWFQYLFESSYSWPGLAEVLELLRRNEITHAEALLYMKHAGIPPELYEPLLALRRQYLAPADAALGLLRHTLSEGRAHEAARVAGMTIEDFETLVDNTGEPPALEEMLSLWRRGKISTEKLDRAIRQSRVRNEWIDEVHLMGVIPPTPQQALQAFLEGQIDEEEARRRYKEGGGDMSWFQHAFDSEGSAPSPVELGELANRGIIPWEGKGPRVTSFHQGFLEGPWRNKWLEPMRKLAQYYPPPRTISALVKQGAIDKREALKLLHEQGLDAQLAAAYVKAATTEKTVKHKELAVGQISELYRDEAIGRHEAVQMWRDLGYDEHEANFLAILADLARVKRYTETAISTTHTRYTSHAIDRYTASSDLDQLGVPAKQRESLLLMWDLERQAKVKRLTAAEVHKAVKKSLLTADQGLTRLEQMGYPRGDAEIYLKL